MSTSYHRPDTLDRILKEAWQAGTILAGLSAGAICWFEQGVTDSVPKELNALSCLGYLAGSFCPHYDGEKERRPAYHRLRKEEKISDGYGVDDGVALHFIESKLEKIVSSRPYGKAYRIEKKEDEVIETQLDPLFLNSP